MEKVLEFMDANNLVVIEDSAQGLGSTWKGRPLGTFAPLGAISFHETKNIHSGLGGCLIVNNDDLVSRAEIVWGVGLISAFFRVRGQIQLAGSRFLVLSVNSSRFLIGSIRSYEENLVAAIDLGFL